MTNIYPTHSCFDDAIENLIHIMKRDGRDRVMAGRLLIVHGIICPDGEDIAHAWLERDAKTVIFSGIMNNDRVVVEAELTSYYAESKVKETTKYTLFEAYAAERRAGHYGPWVERYRELCPDIQKNDARILRSNSPRI